MILTYLTVLVDKRNRLSMWALNYVRWIKILFELCKLLYWWWINDTCKKLKKINFIHWFTLFIANSDIGIGLVVGMGVGEMLLCNEISSSYFSILTNISQRYFEVLDCLYVLPLSTFDRTFFFSEKKTYPINFEWLFP